MMSFCRKSVHSFLRLPDADSSVSTASTTTDSANSPFKRGLGLITATGDALRPPYIIESTLVKLSPPPVAPSRKDPGVIGFIDDIGGGVDGLMSCTESLGFESCDERRIEDEYHQEPTQFRGDERTESTAARAKWRRIGEKREVKKFPPPLSSLNHNGQPNFFLRPVRKDGRLELTEVRIDRPEILRASRQDGRLRLHFIRDNNIVTNREPEPEPEPEVLEEEEEEEEEKENEQVTEVEGEKAEERVEEWKFASVSGGDQGFRRCHELVSHRHHHNHHHDLHVWRQHCVTTG